jgi:hypothetical protein
MGKGNGDDEREKRNALPPTSRPRLQPKLCSRCISVRTSKYNDNNYEKLRLNRCAHRYEYVVRRDARITLPSTNLPRAVLRGTRDERENPLTDSDTQRRGADGEVSGRSAWSGVRQ